MKGFLNQPMRQNFPSLCHLAQTAVGASTGGQRTGAILKLADVSARVLCIRARLHSFLKKGLAALFCRRAWLQPGHNRLKRNGGLQPLPSRQQLKKPGGMIFQQAVQSCRRSPSSIAENSASPQDNQCRIAEWSTRQKTSGCNRDDPHV